MSPFTKFSLQTEVQQNEDSAKRVQPRDRVMAYGREAGNTAEKNRGIVLLLYSAMISYFNHWIIRNMFTLPFVMPHLVIFVEVTFEPIAAPVI